MPGIVSRLKSPLDDAKPAEINQKCHEIGQRRSRVPDIWRGQKRCRRLYYPQRLRRDVVPRVAEANRRTAAHAPVSLDARIKSGDDRRLEPLTVHVRPAGRTVINPFFPSVRRPLVRARIHAWSGADAARAVAWRYLDEATSPPQWGIMSEIRCGASRHSGWSGPCCFAVRGPAHVAAAFFEHL